MKKRIEQIAKKFLETVHDKDIIILSHYDTDGITSAAIMIKTLRRLDKKFFVKIVKNLEESIISNLPKDKVVIFLDLGSNSLGYIEQSSLEDVFIIDHHQIIQQIPKNVNIINPELHGKEKISTSGLTYLFCKELLPESKDLAKLAIVGMIGDVLEKNISRLNKQILEEGEIITKRGPLIYPSTRPLNRVLEFNSNPYIPGITGNPKGVLNFLREAGICSENGKYPSLMELDEQEMSKITTGIMLRSPKIKNGSDIIGDIFLIKLFNKLEDAREISAMINACGRLGEPHIAIQLCLEIPDAKKKSESLYVKYKRLIISGLEIASKIEKIEGKSFVIINAKSSILDTLVGTIASILSNSPFYEDGTMIITMAYAGNKIKVSARGVGKQGRNVRAVLNEVVEKIGGEVGGHEFAAGCLIDKSKEQLFIEEIQKSLEIELVKI